MRDRYCGYYAAMDANDGFIYLGFCPDIVRLTNLTLGDGGVWSRLLGNDAILQRVTAGDYTNQTDKGIKLVQFTDHPLNISADPTVVEPDEYYKANGIQITGDVDALGDNEVFLVEAYRIDRLWVKGIHDGGDNCNTYAQDASIDFKAAGVEGGQQWILFNQSNGDYAYIKSVEKPAGQTKYCRLNLSDSGGADMAAADVDDDDVFFCFNKKDAWYPLSDIGMMS